MGKLNREKNIEYLYLVLLGALSSLSLPPYGYLFINFFSFSLFFIFLIKKKNFFIDKKKTFFFGWLFGFGYFLSNLYWISISLTFDDDFKFLIPITIILIPCFLSIFYGLVTLIFFLFNIKNRLSLFFLFSLLFGSIEYLRGTVLTGFPWNLVVYSFYDYLEIIQITSILGTYALNMLCITLFISPALFFLKKTQKDIIISILFLFLPLIFYIVGYLKVKNFENLDIVKNDYVIRVVSSNIKLDRFFETTETSSVIAELIELSDPSIDQKTLFLWPEGIIPNISQSQLIEFQNLFEEKFNENHLLGLGINYEEVINSKKNFYNSFSIYDYNLNLMHSYNKLKLVPFGEFLPFENILQRLGLRSLTNNYQSYSHGKDREIIEIEQNNFSLKVLPLICYEIIYSGKISKNDNFDYIINISEDGWFGDSIGPHQHFVHSIFRAIENGKYILRSANNGISAIVNPIGRPVQIVPFGETGFIDFKEKRSIDTTFYSKFGNKIFFVMILLYIFLIFSFNRNSK